MDKMERKPAQGMQFETGLTGTPYARVHSAFPSLFEGAIRQRALPRISKTTGFCDISRLRIAPSPDANIADGRGQAACPSPCP